MKQLDVMTGMFRRLAVAGVLMASGFVQFSLAQNVAIGLAGPMSGPLAGAGRSIAIGAQLAAKDINARGGIGGASIVLTTEDDAGSLAGALAVAANITKKNIRIVVGHYTSGPTLAASEIYSRENILLIAPSATAPKLSDIKGLNVVRLAAGENAQGRFAGEWLAREFPTGDIAILRDGTAASRVLAAAARAALERAGTAASRLQDIDLATIGGETNANEVVTRQAQAIAAAGIAAVYWAGSASQAAIFLNALRQAGSTTLFLGSDALAAQEFAVAGDAIDGARIILAIDPSTSEPVRDLAARLRAEGARDIPLALATYAAMQILEQAATRAKSLEPAKLTANMRNGAPVNTVLGAVSFDAKGERREQPFFIAIWKKAADGKFIFAPSP